MTLKLFDWFGNQLFKEVFSYILTFLKIYLAIIHVANCSAEKAFSKLTRIQNKYRTSQTQENLGTKWFNILRMIYVWTFFE